MDKLQIYAAQLGLSTITATIASKCGLLGWMLVAVAAAMVIDFLAGMAASARRQWNTRMISHTDGAAGKE